MDKSKRIVLMCHCILNSHSKVRGLAMYNGVLEPLVSKYISAGIGIIQLPCPEMSYLGLKRWEMTKEQYDTPFFRRHCVEILQPYVDQTIDYINNGYCIEGIIGVEGSPSCGVNITNIGYCGGLIVQEQAHTREKIKGRGVFIEEFSKLLEAHKIEIQFHAVSNSTLLDSKYLKL